MIITLKSDSGIYKIDGFQLTALMVTLVAATTVLFDPHILSRIAGHDGWMSIIIVTLGGAYLTFIFYRLSTYFPGLTLMEYLPMIVGKTAGKIIGLGYILVLIYLNASAIRAVLVFFYGTGVLSATPHIVTVLFLIISTTYGVWAGIETIGRTLSLYWVGLGIVYALVLLLAIPNMEIETLLPLGEASWSTILKASMAPHAFRGEFLVLALILPYCRSPREGFIAGQAANLLISMCIIATTIACVSVLGVESTARSFFGPFFLADFIRPVGIKILLVSIWAIALWGKTTLMQFALTDSLTKLLGLKAHRSVILPLALILLMSALTFYRNATHFWESTFVTLPGVMVIFGYLIPTLLFIIASIKAKFRTAAESPSSSLPGSN